MAGCWGVGAAAAGLAWAMKHRALVGAVCNLVGAVLSLFAAGAGAYVLFEAQPWTFGFWLAVCATLGCAFWTVAAAIAVREELE